MPSKQTFPKIGAKHKFIPLFTPKQAIKKKTKLPSKLILIYSNSLKRRMIKQLKLKKSKTISTDSYITPDQKLIIMRLSIGAPFTAAVVEEAVYCGVKKILILGTAGGISNKLSISDLVLCTKAIRDEGTSHHYIKNSKYVEPDKKLNKNLENLMLKNKVKFQKGVTWTIDAPYAETIEEVNHYRKEGVMTVEMEAAALFAVAKKREISSSAIFTISDILADEWSGFEKKHYREYGYNELIKVAKMFEEI